MGLLLTPRKVTQDVALLTSFRKVLRFIPVRKPNILAEVFAVSLSSSRQMDIITWKWQSASFHITLNLSFRNHFTFHTKLSNTDNIIK